jgi:hypothetical protein
MDRQAVQEDNPVTVDERDSGQVQMEILLPNEELPASARQQVDRMFRNSSF